jgi:hypothetical protein
MGFSGAAVADLALQATTGPNGYTLINGTGTVLSWTAPNDGNLHRFTVFAAMLVSTVETGGFIQMNYILPSGNAGHHTLFNQNLAVADYVPAVFVITVQPGSIVSITQTTALSAGASQMWAEIWGS